MAWMADPRGRDQFLIQHPGEHAVCWNDAKKGAAAPFYTRPYWSDGPMSWSPQGTYAATLHPQGAALWVSREGATFERVVRFSCPGVQKADFSPGEELLTLYSVQERPNAPVDVIMTVFDVRSGRKLRSIVESLPKLLVGRMQINSQGIVEPFLSWSPEAPPMAARLAADTVQARYRRTICCSFACSAGAKWTCCMWITDCCRMRSKHACQTAHFALCSSTPHELSRCPAIARYCAQLAAKKAFCFAGVQRRGHDAARQEGRHA